MPRQPKRTFLDKVFKDKDGRVVLTQLPNAALAVWAAALVASWLIGRGLAHNTFIFIDSVAIFIWALLEIGSGVNYFRRGLGAVILILAIHNRFFT